METCCHRWEAPRNDVRDSLPVTHVCGRVRGHGGPHQCPCEVTAER